MPDLGGLPPAEAKAARARLSELDRACGCGLGAALAAISLGVYLIFQVLGMDVVSGAPPVETGVGAVVFIAGAAVGKTLGRLRVRRARERLIDDLRSRVIWQAAPPSFNDDRSCP